LWKSQYINTITKIGNVVTLNINQSIITGNFQIN